MYGFNTDAQDCLKDVGEEDGKIKYQTTATELSGKQIQIWMD